MARATDEELQQEITNFRVARETIDRLRATKAILQTERQVLSDRVTQINLELDTQQSHATAAREALSVLLGRP